jgi:homocysteine S-methyltransferase
MAVAKYRDDLPQIKTTNKLYITDGGLETDLIFLRNVDLPEFASFPLLDTESGIAELKSYLEDYLQLAVKNKHGLVLEAATWRANKDWSDKLGISRCE